MIIKSHFKLYPFGRDPTYFILSFLPYYERIQQLRKKKPNPPPNDALV
jgi:hypothetical protein